MKRLAFFAALLYAGAAFGQASVRQDGAIVRNDAPKWSNDHLIKDAGGILGDNVGQGFNPFAVTDSNGPGVCWNSGPTTGAYNALCIGHDSNGNGLISLNSFGGQTAGSLNFVVNGQAIPLPGSITGFPNVATNAALQLQPSTFAPAVMRVDYAAGLGAPAVVYTSSNSACSLNAGAGDNGTQVKSADNKCWLLQIPTGGVDLREWGCPTDNVTDCTTAWQNATTWAASAPGNRLILPQGTVFVATGATVTLPANGSMIVEGAGRDVSNIRFGAGVTGLTVNVNSFKQSFSFRRFSCLAAGAGTGICINIVDSGPQGQGAQNDVTSVTFRGSDGYFGTNCWAVGFQVNYFSNINFIDDDFIGCSVNTGIGINLAGLNTISGVVYNITNSNFEGLVKGLVYGDHIQGVTVTNSNFTQDTNGIYVNAGVTVVDQLTVTGGQFGIVTFGINEQSGVPNTSISGALFNITAANSTGIYLGGAFICSITGNNFQSSTVTGTIGLEINTVSAAPGCTISGNTVVGFGVGFQYDTNAGFNIQKGNGFATNTKRFTNTNLNNVITDQAFDPGAGTGAGYTAAAVTGCVNNGSSLFSLTVASTANFVTGQMVAVSGVGGCGVLATNTVIDKIQVLDATHIVLLNSGFSGTYTSGGIIYVLP